MIATTRKDDFYIITMKPQTAAERDILNKILSLDEKRQKEYDYWTIKPNESVCSEAKQLSLELDKEWVHIKEGEEEKYGVPF